MVTLNNIIYSTNRWMLCKFSSKLESWFEFNLVRLDIKIRHCIFIKINSKKTSSRNVGFPINIPSSKWLKVTFWRLQGHGRVNFWWFCSSNFKCNVISNYTQLWVWRPSVWNERGGVLIILQLLHLELKSHQMTTVMIISLLEIV